MADNYLEKRYAEVFGRDNRKTVRQRPSLDSLLLRNRSYRGYDSSYAVHPIQLDAMISVNTRIASGMNAQRLRFRAVANDAQADIVLTHIHLGAALKELGLPLPGTEPHAFIVVCATCPENPIIDIDLGISLQSMSLKAVEMGLGCVIVRNFDAQSLQEALGLTMPPLAVLCVGKPAEKIELDHIHAGDSPVYYRKDGIHHVPKLGLDDIKI